MSDSESEIASQTSEPEEYSDDDVNEQQRFKPRIQQQLQTQEDDSDSSAQDSDSDENGDSFDKILKPAIKIGKAIPVDEMDIAGLDSDDDYNDSDISIDDADADADDDNDVVPTAQKQKFKQTPHLQPQLQTINDVDDEDVATDDDDDENNEPYLQKLDREVVSSYIQDMHPESRAHNYDEVRALSNVVRNEFGIIIDNLHRTIPVMTKFEKTRIIGVRAKQLDDGAQPFVSIPDGVIDGYTIALQELSNKSIPFIVRRPLPNGGAEYWKVSDLEIV